MWDEAVAWWGEQDKEHQAKARIGFEAKYQQDVDEVEALYATAGTEGFLSGFDALWMLFAVASAYGIGRGGKDE